MTIKVVFLFIACLGLLGCSLNPAATSTPGPAHFDIRSLLLATRQAVTEPIDTAIEDYDKHLPAIYEPKCAVARFRIAALLTRVDVLPSLSSAPYDVLEVCLTGPDQVDPMIWNLASIMNAQVQLAREQIEQTRKLEDEITRQRKLIQALKDIEKSIQERTQ